MPSYLSLKQAENVFSDGIDLIFNPYSLKPDVRISWPTLGAPGWNQSEEIIFVRVFESDDPYNRQRDITYQTTDSDHAIKTTSQTRVWTLNLIAYGPNSYDNQVKIRNRLFSDEVKLFFRKSSLFFIPDISSPVRAPELFNGNWWERTDLSIRFNELVRYEPEVVNYFESVEVKINSQVSTGDTNTNQDAAGSTPENKVQNTEIQSRVPESEKEDKEIARCENFGVKIFKS